MKILIAVLAVLALSGCGNEEPREFSTHWAGHRITTDLKTGCQYIGQYLTPRMNPDGTQMGCKK